MDCLLFCWLLGLPLLGIDRAYVARSNLKLIETFYRRAFDEKASVN